MSEETGPSEVSDGIQPETAKRSVEQRRAADSFFMNVLQYDQLPDVSCRLSFCGQRFLCAVRSRGLAVKSKISQASHSSLLWAALHQPCTFGTGIGVQVIFVIYMISDLQFFYRTVIRKYFLCSIIPSFMLLAMVLRDSMVKTVFYSLLFIDQVAVNSNLYSVIDVNIITKMLKYL